MKIEQSKKQQKRKEIGFIFLWYVLGFIAGILFARLVQSYYWELAKNWQESFYIKVTQLELNKQALFYTVFIKHIKEYLSLWIMSITILGIPYIVLFFMYEGFLIGVTAFIVIGQYQIQGVLLLFSYFFPQIICYIPVFLITALCVKELNKKIGVMLERGKKKWYQVIIEKLPLFFILFIILLIGCILEAYINPECIRFFVSVFQVMNGQ